MLGAWLQHDMESLEAISQDDEAKRIFLRMAALSRDGQMGSFLTELARKRSGRQRDIVTASRQGKRWAIVDSNHGPPPYQSGALTN